MQIKIASIDPSLSNIGIVRASIDLDSMAIEIENISLTQTDRQTTKSVRQNSDDLRRAQQLLEAVDKHVFLAGTRSIVPSVCFAEVPVGSQSSRAMCSYGVCVGLLASIASRMPLIQVQPTEVKMAAVGTKTASKQEMVEWATGLLPQLPWFTTTKKGVTKFSDKNEHIADAIAAIHAGIHTDEFKRMVAMWKLMRPAAA